ncbi:MAG: hypothetical protein AB1295_00440 [Candidatus Micrarchaeota archaeon]
MRGSGSGLSDAIRVLLFIPIIMLAIIGIIAFPYLLDYVNRYVGEHGFAIPELPGEKPFPPADTRPADVQKYYQLKNLSCGILAKDFLLQTQDTSRSRVSGLLSSVSGEEVLADSIASQYDSEQTTGTYVKGTWMKKVISTPSANSTTIWKEGRIYQCAPTCTMNLLGDDGWQAHLDVLERMRTGCAYFGRTAMPEDVDMLNLISIVRVGREDHDGFRCERFMITGNKTYAKSLLASNLTLDEDQRALLWGIAHLEGPMEECLDDGVGIVVWRNLTIDLTESYRFDYTENGGMFVDQYTELLYYTDSVPDSFFALPS